MAIQAVTLLEKGATLASSASLLQRLIIQGQSLRSVFQRSIRGFETRSELSPLAGGTEWLVLLVYVRAIAMTMLIAGLIHWGRLLGLSDWRSFYFIEMPLPWQVATIYFAVCQLVAGVGLWMAASWGIVMWVLVAGSQIASHTVFVEEFGSRPWEISFYFLTLSLFMVIRNRVDRHSR